MGIGEEMHREKPMWKWEEEEDVVGPSKGGRSLHLVSQDIYLHNKIKQCASSCVESIM
jgi:hypothetical protein